MKVDRISTDSIARQDGDTKAVDRVSRWTRCDQESTATHDFLDILGEMEGVIGRCRPESGKAVDPISSCLRPVRHVRDCADWGGFWERWDGRFLASGAAGSYSLNCAFQGKGRLWDLI